MLDTIEVPIGLFEFRLPEAVQARLQYLLERQYAGEALTTEERNEAEGLAELAELMALLDVSAKRRRAAA
jgi:hypothetical protein